MDVDKVEAGHKLNHLIGTKIIGLPERTYGSGMRCPDCGGEVDFRMRAWCFSCAAWFYGAYSDYSSLIEFAWEVVEKMIERKYTWQADGRGGLSTFIFLDNGRIVGADTAAHLPLAICRAALKAITD
jgi:hypothetical protein